MRRSKRKKPFLALPPSPVEKKRRKEAASSLALSGEFGAARCRAGVLAIHHPLPQQERAMDNVPECVSSDLQPADYTAGIMQYARLHSAARFDRALAETKPEKTKVVLARLQEVRANKPLCAFVWGMECVTLLVVRARGCCAASLMVVVADQGLYRSRDQHPVAGNVRGECSLRPRQRNLTPALRRPRRSQRKQQIVLDRPTLRNTGPRWASPWGSH
jgi:hypothetical protein